MLISLREFKSHQVRRKQFLQEKVSQICMEETEDTISVGNVLPRKKGNKLFQGREDREKGISVTSEESCLREVLRTSLSGVS